MNVYAVPFVRPVTTIALDVRRGAPPGDAVTVYTVIGAPPFEAGAAKLTVPPAGRYRRQPATPVGAPGTVAGVTGLDGADAGPVPTAFVAVTVNV